MMTPTTDRPPATDRLTGSSFSMRSPIRDAALAAAGLAGAGLVDIIIGFARSNGGYCVATSAELAERSGCSTATIKRLLTRLGAAGVIYGFTVRQADGGKGERRALLVADVVPDGLARPAALDDPTALVPFEKCGRSRRLVRVADLRPIDYGALRLTGDPQYGALRLTGDPVLRARASSDQNISERGCVAHAPPVVATLTEPDPEPIPAEVDRLPSGTLGGPMPEIVPSGTVSSPTPETVSSETISANDAETTSGIDPTPDTGTAQPMTPDATGARGPYAKAWPAKITGKKIGPKTTDRRGPMTAVGRIGKAWHEARAAAGRASVRHRTDGGHFAALARMDDDAATWAIAFRRALSDPWIGDPKKCADPLSAIVKHREKWHAQAVEEIDSRRRSELEIERTAERIRQHRADEQRAIEAQKEKERDRRARTKAREMEVLAMLAAEGAK